MRRTAERLIDAFGEREAPAIDHRSNAVLGARQTARARRRSDVARRSGAACDQRSFRIARAEVRVAVRPLKTYGKPPTLARNELGHTAAAAVDPVQLHDARKAGNAGLAQHMVSIDREQEAGTAALAHRQTANGTLEFDLAPLPCQWQRLAQPQLATPGSIAISNEKRSERQPA